MAVYFSCVADIGSPDQGAYRFLRDIPIRGTIEERIEETLLAYLQGPSDEERSLGYLTAITTPAPDLLEAVSVEGGRADISFAPALEQSASSTTAAASAFLVELQATLWQFDDVDQFGLAIGGDCERFWRLVEASCALIDRGQWPPGPRP